MQDISLKGYAKRIFIVTFGLVIAAYGVGLTVTAGLGVSPWDVFGQGVALKMSDLLGVEVMMGTITQITAALVIIADLVLKEKIGVATIIDTCIFGGALNFFLKHNMLPTPETFAGKWSRTSADLCQNRNAGRSGASGGYPAADLRKRLQKNYSGSFYGRIGRPCPKRPGRRPGGFLEERFPEKGF